jgi:hypothetical protein
LCLIKWVDVEKILVRGKQARYYITEKVRKDENIHQIMGGSKIHTLKVLFFAQNSLLYESI